MKQIRYKVDAYEVNPDTGNHPQARGTTGYAVGRTKAPIIKIEILKRRNLEFGSFSTSLFTIQYEVKESGEDYAKLNRKLPTFSKRQLGKSHNIRSFSEKMSRWSNNKSEYKTSRENKGF